MEHLLNTYEDNREIFFNVSTQPVYGLHSGDKAPNKKMLMRSNGYNNDRTYLDVVNDKYRVVENREVLEQLQRQMINFFDPLVLEDVQIKDTVAANGLQCYAEYVFPSIKSEIETSTGHKTNLGLRFVMKNSFDGKGSVTFWSGVIDFFCTNGMVNGVYDVTRKRHSKNFSTEGFIEAFAYSMDRHQESVKMYQRYADTQVGTSLKVQQLFDKLTKTNRAEKKRDGGLADRLWSQWMDEVKERGNNLFSVQSAMTHYASHDDDGRFNLTKDSDGGTLYKRSEQVTKWLSSPTWKDFVEHVSA